MCHSVFQICVSIANHSTPAIEGLMSDPKNYGYDVVKEMLQNIPCGGRLVEPDEIAYAVGVLCEEKARFINGIHLHVNGGIFID
jgi:NAD(P)-dependent dehydrogenase (short-subunit alcohol dehydrogenase family)